MNAVNWLQNELNTVAPGAWMIYDIPQKDVMFTKSMDAVKKDLRGSKALHVRDSVKIVNRHGEAKLLVDASNSLVSILAQYRNFIPRIYVSPATYEVLEAKGILKKMREQKFD